MPSKKENPPALFDYKDEVHKLVIYLFRCSGNQYQMTRALINSCVLLRLTVTVFLGFPEMPEAFEENESEISHSITVHSYNTYLLITQTIIQNRVQLSLWVTGMFLLL